jgi:hypothetical protein
MLPAHLVLLQCCAHRIGYISNQVSTRRCYYDLWNQQVLQQWTGSGTCEFEPGIHEGFVVCALEEVVDVSLLLLCSLLLLLVW